MGKNSINCKQEKTEVKGSERIKLKRNWSESEDSSVSCGQLNTKKQNVVNRSCGMTTGQICHEFTAFESTQQTDSRIQSSFTEKGNKTKKTGSSAGIAEQRLVRLKKTLEKQKTLSPRKNSNVSKTPLPEKRSPTAANIPVLDGKVIAPTQSISNKQSERLLPNQGSPRAANTSIADRKAILPTECITTKHYERLLTAEGGKVAANMGVSGRNRSSPTYSAGTKRCKRLSPQQAGPSKKNVAANRLKALQAQLNIEMKKNVQGNQNKNVQGNQNKNVQGNQNKNVQGNQNKNVQGNQNKNVQGNQNKNVQGNQNKNVQGNQNKNVQPQEPVYVVVHDSHKINDEAEFLKIEEQMLMDVQELREEIHKAGGVNPEEIEEMICEIIPSSFPVTKSNLYIVVDTNVLVSNCQSIDRLCNTNIQGIGCPVFIIPWMVLHELDILKDRRDVTKSRSTAVQAQKAIKFLHMCFSTKHPRVIGQTVSDAGPDALNGLCNPDNSILQCCLQQMRMGHRVVLLTDDKNLQNKCMVNGIDAVGKSDLKDYLDRLSKQSKNETETPKTHTFSSEESAFEEPVSRVKVLVTNLMHCAKEVLSKIILQEMETAYGETWMDVICVKPPFSLDDIFTCLMRHWMAVFGLVMSKNSLATVKEMKKLCDSHSRNKRDCRISVDDVKNVAIRFARLLSEFVKPLYSKMIKEAQLYLENLISDCENPFSRSELKNSVTFSEPVSEWVVSKHLVVVETIRRICIALVELCQQLRMVITQDQSSAQTKPQAILSEDGLKTWVAYFYGPVSNLYLIMESVASAKEAQAMNSPEMVPVMDHMYKDFSELYRLISSGEQMEFTVKEMFSFFEDCETSDIFKEIKEQFHNCGVIMRQAIDHFSEKDIIPFTNNRPNSVDNNVLPEDVEMEEQFSDT